MESVIGAAAAAILVTAIGIYFAFGLYHWLRGTPDEPDKDDPVDGRGMF